MKDTILDQMLEHWDDRKYEVDETYIWRMNSTTFLIMANSFYDFDPDRPPKTILGFEYELTPSMKDYEFVLEPPKGNQQ